MPRWSTLVGMLLLGGGLFGSFWEDSNHNACNSGLGQYGQAVSENIARHCGIYNSIFYVAIVVTIVGAALLVAAVLVRS